MKKNIILYTLVLFLFVPTIYAMDLVYTPTFSGKINGFQLEEKLLNENFITSSNLTISRSGQYIIVTHNNRLYLLDVKKILRDPAKKITPEHVTIIKDHKTQTDNQMLLALIEEKDHLVICSIANATLKKEAELVIRKIINNKVSTMYADNIPGTIRVIKPNKTGTQLAIAYQDTPTIQIFDIKHLKNIQTIQLPINKKMKISAINFHLDGNALFIGTTNGSLYCFDLEKNTLRESKTFVQKSSSAIQAINHLQNDLIQLTTENGDILILNNEGEIKKRFQSLVFGEKKGYKRNNAVIAPYSPAIAFYLNSLNLNREVESNELSHVELQIQNKIFTLQTPNIEQGFFKKSGHYGGFLNGHLICVGMSDLINNAYTITALSSDSHIHIWQIPTSSKFKKLKSGISRVLDNGSLTELHSKLKKETTNILERKYTSLTLDRPLPQRRDTLREIIDQAKKDEIARRKKNPRPAPPLPRAKTTIIRKPRKRTIRPKKRSYSVDTGLELIHESKDIFDIIHKQINIHVKINMLRTLFNNHKKINLNEKDHYGNTPLYWEVQKCNKPIVKLLLDYKANPNTKNNDGNSPLHAAVQKSNYKMVKLLLNYNSNPNIQDAHNNTPTHYAAKNNLYKIMTLLLRSHAHSCIPNNEGNTILHMALIYNYSKVIQEIMKICSYATLTFQNQEGNTPLHIAIAHKLNTVALKLIKKKVPLNVQNYFGNTPLHLAVHHKNHTMINALTKKRAKFDIPNYQGNTALDLME